MSKLDTQNLALKVRTLADVDALLKLYTAVGLPGLTRDSIVKSVFLSDTHWRKNGFGAWSIFLKTELIGSIALKRLPDSRICLEIEIDPVHRKKGFAKEASNAVLSFGFRLHKIPEVVSTVKSLNTSAIKLLESLGFTTLESTADEITLSLKNTAKK